MKHTPEPWKWFKQDNSGKPHYRKDWFIDSATRGLMAVLSVEDINSSKTWREKYPDVVKEYEETLIEVEANAERIVACVNACVGIEDPVAFIEHAKKMMEV